MKDLLFSVFAILLIGVLFIPAAFAVEYDQIVSTSSGSLDVGIYTEPDIPYSGELTIVKIHFLLPDTTKLYEHIDYWSAVSKDGNYISGPSALKHTNPGTATISVEFPENGSYIIHVDVFSIYFHFLPQEHKTCTVGSKVYGCETATFTMNIGQAEPEQEQAETSIPGWIKNNAGWWADGQIDDGSFVSGIQWLITNGIMTIPPTEQGTGSDDVIPSWIKNNAGWWADGQIDDSSFVSGLQWLISNGIMKIS